MKAFGGHLHEKNKWNIEPLSPMFFLGLLLHFTFLQEPGKVIIAQWLARQFATRKVRVRILARERIINSHKRGVIKLNLNCDMVHSIHAQRLVQVEHMHPAIAIVIVIVIVS